MATSKKATEHPDISAAKKRLGVRLRTIRVAKGYTSHEQFAYQHDINRVQYNRYERGQDLRFSTLVKIVKAFDMTLEEFFSEGFE